MNEAATPPPAPPIVGVVGRSGSGKTSLLECLVPAARLRGLHVGAIKHTSHGFLADQPGKDSYRLFDSGADAVALISRQQLATFVRRSVEDGAEVQLSAALDSMPPGLDLILVEGFSWESIPRFVVVPDGEEPLAAHTQAGQVLGRVRVPGLGESQKPVFDTSLINELADQLAELAGTRSG